MRLGRNDLCWCGSGKKYKHCHWDRSEQPRASFWDGAKALRRRFSTKDCLVPLPWRSQCHGHIVRAHTVAKQGSLRLIAEKGHVFSALCDAHEMHRSHGRPSPVSIGINEASTFTGFCSRHDKSLFAPVEDQPFETTPEQCFFLSYRSVARELYQKRAGSNIAEVLREADRGKSFSAQVSIQQHVQAMNLGMQAGLRSSEAYKTAFDALLLAKDFGGLESVVLRLGTIPPLMCSGGFFPEDDLYGNPLQRYSVDDNPQMITLNIFASEGAAFIVFSWLSSHATSCRRLCDSLLTLPPKLFGEAVARLSFTYIENTFISPTWWQERTEGERSVIRDLMLSGTTLRERKPDDVRPNAGIVMPLAIASVIRHYRGAT